MHSDFSSSRLVRLVGAWTAAPPPTGMDFAERLGLWLNAFDAIKLQGTHQVAHQVAHQGVQHGLRARPAAAAPTARLKASVHALQEQVQRVRAALAHAIAQDPLAWAAADAQGPGYTPFQRRHGELQRHMEQMILPLREQARLSLAAASPRGKALAALDEAMQQMLAAREQSLLAGMPGLLAQRFAQLHAAPEPVRQLALAVEGQAPAAAPLDAEQRLQAFAQDWRLALLAELDLRLEPVAGLVASLQSLLNEQATLFS